MSERLDQELDLKAIVWFAIGLVLVTAVSAAVLWYLSGLLLSYEQSQDPEPPALAAASVRYEPPAPRLQTDPVLEMEALRAAEDAILETYGWVDADTGIARIPIERAIELAVARAEAGESP